MSFNDLGPGCSPGIPAVYHGLIWSSNFQLECNVDYSTTYGNSNGSPSGYAATNGSAPGSDLVELSIGAGTFDFLGASFSSFAGNDQFQAFSAESLQVYAYRPGDDPDHPTFVLALDLDPAHYVPYTLPWTGINAVFFGADAGPVSDSRGGVGVSWLMTDAAVNVSSVPEPSTLSSIGIGLIGVAFLLASKRS